MGPIVTALRECETLARIGGAASQGPSRLLHEDLMQILLRPDEANGFGLAQVWRDSVVWEY